MTRATVDPHALPPETAAKLKEQFANRPPVVTKTEVTKVSAKDLSADTFEIPAGYTKREPMAGMGHPGGMNGHGMPPAAGAHPSAPAPE